MSGGIEHFPDLIAKSVERIMEWRDKYCIAIGENKVLREQLLAEKQEHLALLQDHNALLVEMKKKGCIP